MKLFKKEIPKVEEPKIVVDKVQLMNVRVFLETSSMKNFITLYYCEECPSSGDIIELYGGKFDSGKHIYKVIYRNFGINTNIKECMWIDIIVKEV
jgi:hypothetical protein